MAQKVQEVVAPPLSAELRGELQLLNQPAHELEVVEPEVGLAEEFQAIFLKAKSVKGDVSVIDTSEVSDESDKLFLAKCGSEILTIEAKADFLKTEIAAAIDRRASLSLGPIVYAVQMRFEDSKINNPELHKFWHSLGYWSNAMASLGLERGNRRTITPLYNAARAYRQINDFETFFVDEDVSLDKVLKIPDSTLAAISYLPTEERFRVMSNTIDEEQPIPTVREIQDLARQPEIKLSLAQEKLQLALQKKQAASDVLAQVTAKIEADPNAQKTVDGELNPELGRAKQSSENAERTVKNLNAEIAKLRIQLEEKEEANKRAERAKELAEASRKEAEEQLASVQEDDVTVRRRRVSALSQTLTASLPDVMSDLQKYFAEREYYEVSTRETIEDTCRALVVYLTDKLNGEETA